MKYALIDADVVVQVQPYFETGFIEAPDGVICGWLWDGDVFTPAPPPPPVIPAAVTRRQARQALLLAGLLADVQPAIDAIPDPVQRGLAQIEWDDSQMFERHRPLLIALATALGLDAAALDALFVTAEAL
ncbi:hypothetical protein SAMN05216344_102158 [Polaromonas sp. OV174]|uniref:hypothetical protein n=1 Tax=Polaromonas sp. OV174 TaxID=1855300 RepID=UPI0008ED5E60|nr:hypothetical protein [Polaromonas sp. OV174]SFB73993.1 hypothetical protein SAMN05216344_102158 [Polaromonas sp. OV174]